MPDVGRQVPARDRSYQDVQSVPGHAVRPAHETAWEGVFFGVCPQSASGASSASFRDRDRVGKLHGQAIGQPRALGYHGAAVEDVNRALLGALDGHGHGQRRRPA